MKTKLKLILIMMMICIIGAGSLYIKSSDTKKILVKEKKKKVVKKEKVLPVNTKDGPTLILRGDDIDWKKGVPYQTLSYKTVDTEEVKVKVTNNIDVNKEGTYEEIIEASNSKAITRKVRTIHVKKNVKMATSIPVCMYHWLYPDGKEPSNSNANWMNVKTFEEELKYLKKHKYYFPTYDELRDFIDKKISLPKKSVILSFDDGRTQTLKYLKKLSKKYEIPITSFLITSNSGKKKVKKYSNGYIEWESHTHNMHRGGGSIGHGGIFTALSIEEGVKDLKKSISICGNGHALAYPYGDTNDSSVKAVKKAGFEVAFTTQPGQVKPGDNPYLLPRVRMFNHQKLKTFISSIS